MLTKFCPVMTQPIARGFEIATVIPRRQNLVRLARPVDQLFRYTRGYPRIVPCVSMGIPTGSEPNPTRVPCHSVWLNYILATDGKSENYEMFCSCGCLSVAN